MLSNVQSIDIRILMNIVTGVISLVNIVMALQISNVLSVKLSIMFIKVNVSISVQVLHTLLNLRSENVKIVPGGVLYVIPHLIA